MRSLVQFITEITLTKPSSPIVSPTDNEFETKHIKYFGKTEFQSANKYDPSFSGVHHKVEWTNKNHHNSPKDKIKKLIDAGHLHQHYIHHNTKVGDVVTNYPLKSEGDKPKRGNIYKRFGFGATNDDNKQHGIVKQHPDDHPDEDKRGKKYLHPLEHTDVEKHGNAPTTGANDNTVRTMYNHKRYETKINNHVYHHEPTDAGVKLQRTRLSNHGNVSGEHDMTAHAELSKHNNPVTPTASKKS
jgi:hypothetical protein